MTKWTKDQDREINEKIANAVRKANADGNVLPYPQDIAEIQSQWELTHHAVMQRIRDMRRRGNLPQLTSEEVNLRNRQRAERVWDGMTDEQREQFSQSMSHSQTPEHRGEAARRGQQRADPVTGETAVEKHRKAALRTLANMSQTERDELRSNQQAGYTEDSYEKMRQGGLRGSAESNKRSTQQRREAARKGLERKKKNTER